MGDLKKENLEYETVEEFLTDLKKEFGRRNETIKVTELKKIKQENKTIEKFGQEFRRVAKKADIKKGH